MFCKLRSIGGEVEISSGGVGGLDGQSQQEGSLLELFGVTNRDPTEVQLSLQSDWRIDRFNPTLESVLDILFQVFTYALGQRKHFSFLFSAP